MDDPGQRLKRARERLGLKYRDVEEFSTRIAERHRNSEFAIAISRLSDIENRGVVPSVYKLYSLCAIYRLEMTDVLLWYGVDLGELPADVTLMAPERSHLVSFAADSASMGSQARLQVPISLDPGLDLQKTTFLSRFIQSWGILPVMLLAGLDLKAHRYGFLGLDDWFMYPLLQPGSLLLIDETRNKIATSGWTNEFERPIYFLEHRSGYACSWCDLADDRLVLQPHPSSKCSAQVYRYPAEIEVIGQVVGVAMRLGPDRKRRSQP
jgi:transcriptional regulator with XRE-family HTH domain